MTGKYEGRETGLGNLNAQFFGELADQAFFRGFARNKLTAGEFPEPFERFTTWSLSDEYPAVDIDQRGRGYQDEWLRRHFSRPYTTG